MKKTVLIFALLVSFLIISCGSDDNGDNGDNVYSEYNGFYKITYTDDTYHTKEYFRLKAGDLYTKNGVVDFLKFTYCDSSDESSCGDGFFSNYSVKENSPGFSQIQSYNGECSMRATYGFVKHGDTDDDVILTYEHRTGTVQASKCDLDTLHDNLDKLKTETTTVIKGSLVK